MGTKNRPGETVVNHLKAELDQVFVIENHKVQFRCVTIVADIPAKANVLSMYKNNGYNGCNLCTADGKTIGKSHSYYPFEQEFEYRTPELNDRYVEIAEALNGGKHMFNVVGVKGRSEFAKIVPGLPLAAGVEYMHCVLLGVYKNLLNFQLTKLSSDQKKQFNSLIKRLNTPMELISHSRKIRDLNDLAHFKATEFSNYFFYIGVAFMGEFLPKKLYDHYLSLVFGVRLLLESSEPNAISMAGKVLGFFGKHIQQLCEDQKVETINVHSLKHIPRQNREFDPFFVFSAMSFESQNRQLSLFFTGTHSHFQVKCRRYIQQRLLLLYDIEEDPLSNLLSDWLSLDNHKADDNYTNVT